MQIQTLDLQKEDLLKTRLETDNLITQMNHEIQSLREEKVFLQQTLQKFKKDVTEVFSEVEILNKRIQTLEKQHKHRDQQEKENLDKFSKLSEKFLFVMGMLKKVDSDFMTLTSEHKQLITKYNHDKQLIS